MMVVIAACHGESFSGPRPSWIRRLAVGHFRGMLASRRREKLRAEDARRHETSASSLAAMARSRSHHLKASRIARSGSEAVANDSRWHASHDCVWRHVAGDNRARGDYRSVSDDTPSRIAARKPIQTSLPTVVR